MRKIIKNKKGVSEIVGTILLLGMAIALFVGVHIVALDVIPYTPNAPSVRISGAIDLTTNPSRIYLQHKGGDSLSNDTKIIFSKDGVTIGDYKVSDEEKTIGQNIGQDWNIGEIISYQNDDFSGIIQMIIIDIESNAIIAQDIFQG